VLVHYQTNRTLAGMLAALEPPGFPVALGVLYNDPATPYEADVYKQVAAAGKQVGGLNELLKSTKTWSV